MKKFLFLIIVSIGLVGCVSQKTVPPVSGGLEPVNTPEVMNTAGK